MGSMISLSSQIPDNRNEDAVDVKALQDRLKQSEARVTDFRNQCQSLRQELKVANKVNFVSIHDLMTPMWFNIWTD